MKPPSTSIRTVLRSFYHFLLVKKTRYQLVFIGFIGFSRFFCYHFLYHLTPIGASPLVSEGAYHAALLELSRRLLRGLSLALRLPAEHLEKIAFQKPVAKANSSVFFFFFFPVCFSRCKVQFNFLFSLLHLGGKKHSFVWSFSPFSLLGGTMFLC